MPSTCKDLYNGKVGSQGKQMIDAVPTLYYDQSHNAIRFSDDALDAESLSFVFFPKSTSTHNPDQLHFLTKLYRGPQSP